MISDDDRSLLTAALESALQAHQKQEPRPSLLSDPDQSSSTPLATPLPSVQRSSKWLDTCFTAAALGTRDRCALVCNASFSQSRTEVRQRNSRSGRLVAAITSTTTGLLRSPSGAPPSTEKLSFTMDHPASCHSKRCGKHS